ncbi:MAG: hypothetical protein IJ809_02265 [Clostridia bacterium]|nr:hypothetical protein [Clostridia bacterium]
MEYSNIIGNLSAVFEKIFGSVEKDVFSALDEIFVIDASLLNKEPLNKIIMIDGINYMNIIAHTLILLYAIYYIFTTFISMYNGAKRGSTYKFIVKVVVIAIIASFSTYLCEVILEINSGFTYAIDSFGKKAISSELDFTALKDKIISIEDYLKEDTLSLNGIIKGMVSFGSISLLLTFAIRYVTIILLVFVSPIAIICLASDLTSGLFFTYVKALVINIFVQNIAKIVILIPLACGETSEVVYKIIMAGSIYIIYKINNYSKQLFSRITSGNIGRGDS